MTAFADGEMSADNLAILCELRSVNHRYSDVSVKLPERLRFAEADVRRLISEKLKRGKIECALSYKKQAGEASFNVNREIVQRLLAATAAIEAEMGNPQPFSALDVLAFPGVQQEQETDKEALRDKIIQLLDETLDKMLETRAREGAQLAQLLEDRCQKVILLVEAAHKRMPEVLNNLRNKLTAQIGRAHV